MLSKQELQNYIKSKREAVLIVNTHSRKGRALFFRAIDLLKDRGIKLTATFAVHDPVRLPEAVQEAIRRGNKLIIVGGGDGTISSIVDFFAYQDVVLGVLPLGTGNVFVTKTMKIPKTIEGAIDVIANGEVADIDLGKAGDDYFSNTVSLGFTADVARATPRLLKKWLGIGAYAIIGARNLFSREKFKCTISLPGQTLEIHTHQVLIANGSYYGLAKLAPHAHIDSGRLLIFTMESYSRWQMARVWLRYFFGPLRQQKEIRYYTAEKVTITADPQQYLDIDGEIVTQTPAYFQAAPEALKILAPANFEKGLREEA